MNRIKTKRTRKKNLRQTREYRIAMIKHKRSNPRCVVCGTIKGRQIHHKYSVAYYPYRAASLNNLVTLCGYNGNNCHKLLHVTLMGSYRKKTTEKDFINFMKLVTHKERILRAALM